MAAEKTKAILNQAVADLSQLAAMIHQVHWYVRGKSFYDIHEKMDEYMDEINEQLDEVAERLIIMGGEPYSTLDEFVANTKLKARKGDFNLSVDTHLELLVDCYKYIAKLYEDAIEIAESEDDPVTADIFTTLKAPIEKTIWMLNAYMGKAPGIY